MTYLMKSREPGPAKEKSNKAPEVFDKYWYYHNSVQSADVDVEFFKKTYEQVTGKAPKHFREDFCGTFSLSCEWVKLNENHTAVGIDLDAEPIAYGKENYLAELQDSQQKRIELLHKNVLDPSLPKADIIAACNFSYFIFKERKVLKEYFANVFNGLEDDGIFIADCFGGTQSYEPNEEETEHDDFSYFWDQDSFDPITNEAMFYIHFKPKGKKKVTNAFTYDWRLWSIPEIKDILEEVGFKCTVYWEGTDEDGEGDGEFEPAEQGEDCESWVAYLVCQKA